MMANKIPAEQLHRAEAKCNALLEVQEDYGHVISDLEKNYRTRVRQHRVRQIVGGGAGPQRIVLEEAALLEDRVRVCDISSSRLQF